MRASILEHYLLFALLLLLLALACGGFIFGQHIIMLLLLFGKSLRMRIRIILFSHLLAH